MKVRAGSVPVLLLTGALLASCSGGGGTARAPGALPVAHASGTATATLKITVPPKTTGASTARKPAYVSPATQSIAITLTPSVGSPQSYNQDLTPGTNPNCTASLISPEICTVTMTLAPGNYTATFATYDGLLDGSSNPTGNVLSQDQSVALTIVAGQANSINVTLAGVPVSVALIPGATSTVTGSQSVGYGLSKCFASQSVSVVGLDADNNYILGPGAPTVSLASSDTTQLAVTPPATSAPNTFTLTRPGIPNGNASITLTAQAAQSGGGQVSTAPIPLTFDGSICGTFTEHAIPTSNSAPALITVGPDGALWFTEGNSGANKIGRITTNGSLTEFAVPTPNADVYGITSGPDGALWFTELLSNKIGRITTGGSFTEYDIPTPSSSSYEITTGPDGALWFAELTGDKIGRITTGGAITEYAVPTTGGEPYGIAAGSDGALWFVEIAGTKIGRITTGGIITEYAIPNPSAGAYGMAAGPDGALWFAELAGNKIGRITTSGTVSEFSLTASSEPQEITAGPDGAVWFNEFSNKIGRIAAGGAVTQYNVPTANSVPYGITTGPDGGLWFTELNANKIGRLQ